MSIFVPNKVYLRGIYYTTLFKRNLQLKRIEFLDTTCRDWFRRFKNNDFQLEDKERSGAPTKFQDKELEQLLDHGGSLSTSIDALEADRRFHSYEEAQKWIDSWIASKDMSFFRRGIHVLPERWEKVVSSDGQYFK
ncbi:MOS1T transposase, partial [Pseudoatta argentina]